MKTNVRVCLQTTIHADRRTKNRVREHGPHFLLEDKARPACLHGQIGLYLSADDGWTGWIPASHVAIVEEAP